MIKAVEFVSRENALIKAIDQVNHFLKENDGKVRINDVRHSVTFDDNSGYIITSYVIFYEEITDGVKEMKRAKTAKE